MDELRQYYREGLTARIEALEQARRGLAADPAAARETIAKIAHQLKGSGATYGFPEITEAARPVEEAGPDELKPLLERFLAVLRDVVAGGDTDQIRILVIDDDPAIGMSLEPLLAAASREIIVAHSAAEAAEVLARRSITLVLLDLMLPDADGRQLLTRLKEDPATAGIPLIVLSARTGAQTQAECLALGADAYVTKPFDPVVLSATVSSRLQQAVHASIESRRDTLTGIANRAAFCEAFGRAAATAARSARPLTLAILDLDHFKRVNDTYGHGMGDEVLKRVTTLVAQTLRASDLLARWGGEEFVALLPMSDLAASRLALERALAAVRAEKFVAPDGTSFSVTFSAGLALVNAGLPVSEAVSRADHFLYLAKEAGRDRVFTEEDAVAAPRASVLLAEDDDMVAMLVRERLTGEGLEVTRCADGVAALAALRERIFSLVLLDIRMPEKDGFAVLDEWRRASPIDRTPVIILTSLGAEEDVVRGFELGASDYVVKPFSMAELLARIRRLLKN